MNLSTFDNFKRRHFDGAVELSPDDVAALQKTLVMILQDMAEVGMAIGAFALETLVAVVVFNKNEPLPYRVAPPEVQHQLK